MLHYNFPPFSVAEVSFMRGAGRREIGHGALAERALLAVLPSEEEFPYAMRVVADILESNGSSSMATVCGGSLSMMDAGIPLRAPVAGVAMGLVKEGDDYAILTDIAGAEDHYGDMDFKVTGTTDGHHRAADGHQDSGHHAPDHARSAATGQAWPAVHPRQDERGDQRGAHQGFRVRTALLLPCRFRPTRSATSSARAARSSAASSRRPGSRSMWTTPAR